MKELEVRNLRISFKTNNGHVRAVRDISFDLEKGETLASIEAETDGYAFADIELRQAKSLYTIIGNFFVYICIAFYLILIPVGILLRKCKPQEVIFAKHYGKTGKNR